MTNTRETIETIPGLCMEIVEDCHEIDGDVIFWDTETFYSKEYSVENTDARTYCADPRGYCYIISVTDGKRVWSGTPKDFDWEIVRGKKLCAFNQNFDAAVYYFMLGAPGDSPMSGWLCAKAPAITWDFTVPWPSSLRNALEFRSARMSVMPPRAWTSASWTAFRLT